MLGSFLRLAYRNLKRDVYSTTLYFLLLVVGISSFAIILTIYNHEVTYDKFFKESDRLFRATTYFTRGNQEIKWAITNGHLVTILEENIPEVEQATKFQTVQHSLVLEAENRKFDIAPNGHGFYTDPDFLEVLPYPLKLGDPKTALSEPRSIVLSEAYARRFFNRVNVVGETLRLEFSGEETYTLKVTGVLEDIPSNSNLQFDLLISQHPWGGWERYGHPVRGGHATHVYFRTNGQIGVNELNEKLGRETKRVYVKSDGTPSERQYPVQKFTDIHFNADNLFEPGVPGNLLFVRILLTVGIVILAISAINFSILYTAKSLVRAKEIGIRKTLGSSHSAIGLRLIAESCLLSLICAILAIGLGEVLLQTVVKTHLYQADLSLFSSPILITSIILAGIVLGLISGSYVTVKSVVFNPTDILRGKLKTKTASFLGTRNLLVVFQFILTSTLITASLMIIKQVRYIENMDLGYEKEAVIRISKPSNMPSSQMDAFRNKLLTESSVLGAGFVFYEFLGTYNAGGVSIIHEGDTLRASGQANMVDSGLIEALNLEIVEGRNFSKEILSDSMAIIINEAAKRQLGLEEVAGRTIYDPYNSAPRKIVGVVKDYHYQSFMNEIPPLILNNLSDGYRKTHLMVRLAPQNQRAGLERIKNDWDEISAGIPFEPVFLDSSFSVMVKKETGLSQIISTYTLVSIIVASLGFIGLVRYTNEERKKEMGIRKVYGAREADVLWLVSTYFGKLILLAFVVSIPLSVYAINSWLDSFAYHTSQGVLEYVISGVILIGLAFGLTNFQTLRMARTNPTDVLKDE
ncbi:ABC transporter permease [Roseivirga pacifica]|uniref:ABC transporter permease n=1 Tax=Roseivirga pacifica TaxID=1267423 RepID=UPI003BAEC850